MTFVTWGWESTDSIHIVHIHVQRIGFLQPTPTYFFDSNSILFFWWKAERQEDCLCLRVAAGKIVILKSCSLATTIIITSSSFSLNLRTYYFLHFQSFLKHLQNPVLFLCMYITTPSTKTTLMVAMLVTGGKL